MPKVSRKGGARPGAGRKPAPPESKQRHRVVVILTDGEYETLLDAADETPLGTYCRTVITRHLARRKK